MSAVGENLTLHVEIEDALLQQALRLVVQRVPNLTIQQIYELASRWSELELYGFELEDTSEGNTLQQMLIPSEALTSLLREFGVEIDL